MLQRCPSKEVDVNGCPWTIPDYPRHELSGIIELYGLLRTVLEGEMVQRGAYNQHNKQLNLLCLNNHIF